MRSRRKAQHDTLDTHSHIVRPAEMEWRATRFPGCEVKPLLVDKETGLVTALMKFAPGAVLPDHEHVKIEQTYLLEGTLVDKEGAAEGLTRRSRRVRLARGRQPPRRLDAAGRADARHVPGPQPDSSSRTGASPIFPAPTGTVSGDTSPRTDAEEAAALPTHAPRVLQRPRRGRLSLVREANVLFIRSGRGETVDARDLKSLGGNPVRVQVPPSAPSTGAKLPCCFSIFAEQLRRRQWQ